MIKNAKSLMDKLRNLSQKYNITTNEALQNYMFERILERLSISKYKNNLILKGGLLLLSICKWHWIWGSNKIYRKNKRIYKTIGTFNNKQLLSLLKFKF